MTCRPRRSCLSDLTALIISRHPAALAAILPYYRRRAAAFLAGAVFLGACDGDARQARAEAGAGARVPALPPYTVVEGPAGRVSGVVEIDGDIPPDTIVRPTSDQRVCGESLIDVTIQRSGSRLGGVVVWLDDLRAGKRLPLERRYSVTNENCALVPRVQAALVGGTLNVRSADPLMHKTRISRASGEVLRIVRHDDDGQVVPVEGVLDQPGWLRLTSDVHPWTVGWLAVFDHPYFDVTPRNGVFSLDSVPPGSYELVARHERFGEVRLPVLVGADQETSVVLRMSAGADAARQAD